MTVLYRINAGGSLVGVDSGIPWSEDTLLSNSEFLLDPGSNSRARFPAVEAGATVPETTPDAIFNTERWDRPGGSEMQWAFDVPEAGLYEVRLFMGNGFSGTSSSGQRIFDVAIEGNVPDNLNDLDLTQQFGHEIGAMVSNTANVTDGTLNLEFRHGVQNPLVNGIEIIQLEAETSTISFTEVTDVAGVAYTGRSFGSSWGDFNGDGFDDLWVTNHFDPGQLFLNQQDGTFTDISDTAFATRSNKDEHGAAWADFDNDGDLDLMQTIGANSQTGPGSTNLLYVNTDGLLVDEAEARGVGYPLGRGRTPAWFDYNNDGLLDLWIGNLARRDRQAPPTFFRQTEDNTFVDARSETGVRIGQSDFVILSDLTGDGKLDLINRGFDPSNGFEIVNVYDMSSLPFTNVTNTLLPNGLNASDFAAADFNNDRLMDFYIANGNGDTLFINNGETLIDRTADSGIGDNGSSASVVTGDFDNDMDVDIFVLKGNSSEQANPADVLYENQGDGTFVTVLDAGGATGTSEGRADSVIVADYDRDGFLDLFATNGEDNGPFGPSQLFRNQGNENNWIGIALEGTVSNRDGIGAKVSLTTGGITQVREQSGGVHKFSQDSTVLHFGLENNTTIDEIVVEWSSGIEQVLTNVGVNQFIKIQETA